MTLQVEQKENWVRGREAWTPPLELPFTTCVTEGKTLVELDFSDRAGVKF